MSGLAGQVRKQALAVEDLPGLVEAEVSRGDDEIRRIERAVVEPLAARADGGAERGERRVQRGLVAVRDCLLGSLVELVEPLRERVVDLPLALAHQPDDHCPAPIAGGSPAGAEPWPSSAFIFASSSSTWFPCVTWASWRSRSSPCCVKSSRAPDVVSSSTAAARACSCWVLSCARCTASPMSAMCSPIPVAASPIFT